MPNNVFGFPNSTYASRNALLNNPAYRPRPVKLGTAYLNQARFRRPLGSYSSAVPAQVRATDPVGAALMNGTVDPYTPENADGAMKGNPNQRTGQLEILAGSLAKKGFPFFLEQLQAMQDRYRGMMSTARDWEADNTPSAIAAAIARKAATDAARANEQGLQEARALSSTGASDATARAAILRRGNEAVKARNEFAAAMNDPQRRQQMLQLYASLMGMPIAEPFLGLVQAGKLSPRQQKDKSGGLLGGLAGTILSSGGGAFGSAIGGKLAEKIKF